MFLLLRSVGADSLAASDLETLFQRVVADLDSLEVRYALIGGFAFTFRVQPRFTGDIDFSVLVETDKQAEQLVWDLGARGYSVLKPLENKERSRLAAVRFGVAGQRSSEPVIDLLFHFSGIEKEVVLEATEEEIFGTRVKVASIPHLIAMKVLAQDAKRRPQDIHDLRALLEVASPEQVDASRKAVSLMVARGFGSDKNLVQDLERLIAQHRGQSPSDARAGRKKNVRQRRGRRPST